LFFASWNGYSVRLKSWLCDGSNGSRLDRRCTASVLIFVSRERKGQVFLKRKKKNKEREGPWYRASAAAESFLFPENVNAEALRRKIFRLNH
jgi:hypothetical protein